MVMILYQKKRRYQLYAFYFYLILLLFRFLEGHNLNGNKRLRHLGKEKKWYFYILTNKNKCIKRKPNRYFPTFVTDTKIVSKDVETKGVNKNEFDEIELAQRLEKGVYKLLFANRGLIELFEELKNKKFKSYDAVLEKGNVLSVEKNKKKKTKTEFLLSDEVPEEIIEFFNSFNFTFCYEKIQKWKDAIEEIIDGRYIILKKKSFFNEELDQMFFRFLLSFLIDNANSEKNNEKEKIENASIEKETSNDQKDCKEQKRAMLADIVNNVAKHIVVFKEIVTELMKKYEITERNVYIDVKTYDIKVQRKNVNEKMSDWKVIFLGTGSMYPSTYRGTSSFIFQTTKKEFNEGFLFDCGENTFLSLQKANIKVSQIKNIFITHLHGDHCLGLISVLTMLSNLNRINIYGPEGLYKFLKNNLNYTYSKRITNFCVHELKQLNVNRMNSPMTKQNLRSDKDKTQTENSVDRTSQEKKEIENKQLKYIYMNEENAYPLFTNEYLEITGFAIKHTIPTVGYIITEKNVKNKFNASYINEIIGKNYEQLKLCKYLQFAPYKIYENIISKMKENDVFTFPDKTELTFENAYKEIYKARKIVICQDTCDPSSLEKFAKDADLLIHEATNSLVDLEESLEDSSLVTEACYANPAESCSDEKEKKQKDIKRKLLEKWLNTNNKNLTNTYNKLIAERGHSTPNMAGTFARKIGAKKLILTHFSQRYIGDNKLKDVVVMRKIEKEARMAFDLVEDPVSSSDSHSDSHSHSHSHSQIQVHKDCDENQNTPGGETNIEGTWSSGKSIYDTNEEDKVVAAWDGLIVYIPHQTLK